MKVKESIHPILAQALAPYISAIEPRQILARERFNDDDLYIYDPNTLELKSQVAACNKKDWPVPVGMAAEIGLMAKNLGLWIKPEGPTDAELAAIARQLAGLAIGLENGSSAAEFATAKLARDAHNLIQGGK